MSNEIQLSQDLNVITAEINSYKQVAGQAIFEIGRRLKYVKENDLVHGEFGKWLETIEMSHTQANRFMKVYEELPENKLTHVGQIGIRALYEIATLPEEEREKEHVTTKGETKTPDEMTVRELQELKKQLKEEKQAKEQTQRQVDIERKERERLELELSNVEPKVIEKEVIKEVDNTDYAQIESLRKQLQEKIDELEIVNSQLNEIKKNSHEYQQLEENLQKLYRDKQEVEEQIEAATSISAIVVDIEEFIKDTIGGIKYTKAVRERLESHVVQNNLEDIGKMLIQAGEDILNLIPRNRKVKEVIDVEVVD